MRTSALIIEPVPKEERHLVPGPAGHMVRTDFQKEYDREYEARMYLSGLRMSDIAERLGVSVATVQRDIEEIRDEWRTARIANMDMLKNMELARLDALEQTYWEAWRDSAKPVVKRNKESINGGQYRMNGVYGGEMRPNRSTTRKVQIEKPNTGDLAALAGVERCIDRRIKLLGLDAPTRSMAYGADGSRPNEAVSDESRVAILITEWRRTKHAPGGDDAERTEIVDGVATERG
jgi:hypothetical protein